MPTITVNPIKTINVRVNQQNKQTVHGATTFIGAANVQSQAAQAIQIAQNASDTSNIALLVAQNAYDTANTKLNISGGTITGDLVINNNLTVSNTIFTNAETIDAGLF